MNLLKIELIFKSYQKVDSMIFEDILYGIIKNISIIERIE